VVLFGTEASVAAAPFAPANAGPKVQTASVPGLHIPRLELDCPVLAGTGFLPRRALNPLPQTLSVQLSATVTSLPPDTYRNDAPSYRAEAPALADSRRLADRLPTSPPDERSGWAQWNSSLPGVTTTVMVFLVTMVGGFSLLPKNTTGWSGPEFSGLEGNFTKGPRFDNDHGYWNYAFHPLGGSEFYMMARNRELTWWQSLAYSAAVSCTFEFFIESAYERASWQDLWITPVSGAFIGELRWQAKKALEDPYSGKPIGALNKVLYVFVDPFEAIYEL
jgi:hypothetical protein